MNEIKLPGYRSGATLTYTVMSADGTEKTPEGTPLTEVRSTGYYKADNATIVIGDVIIIKEAGNVVGGGIYEIVPTSSNPINVSRTSNVIQRS